MKFLPSLLTLFFMLLCWGFESIRGQTNHETDKAAHSCPADDLPQVALIRAISAIDEVCVSRIVRRNVDLDHRLDGKIEMAPVLLALAKGNIRILRTILIAGAKLNNEIGSHALLIASNEGKTEAVRILLEFGADVNAKVKEKATPLMGASNNGHVDVVKLLLESGANVNDVSDEGITTLMVSDGNTQVLKLLIQSGAEIHAVDKNGWTALFHAVKNGELTKIQFLLEKGATLQNQKGTVTAFQVAQMIDDPTTKEKVLEILNEFRI